MRFLSLALALLVAICLLPSHAVCQITWIVDQAGGGDFLTIQEGVDAASDGDSVVVRAGTYEPFNFLGKAITVSSETGATDSVIQDSDPFLARARVTMSSGEGNSSVLRGFTITGGSGFNRGGILVSGASPVIEGNVIENNNSITDGGGIQIDSGSPLIRNNIIRGNEASNSYTGPGLINVKGGGISFAGSGAPRILNNFIQGNTTDCVGVGGVCYKELGGGVYVGGGSPVVIGNVFSGNTTEGNCNYGGGLFVENAADAVVANNTFYQNRSTSHMSACGSNIGGGGAYLGYGITNLLFANNIVQQSIGQGLLCAATTVQAVIETNSFYNNSQGDIQNCPAGSGDLLVDAGLTDPGNGDFHLAGDTPLLDVGTSGIPGLPTEDVYQGLRLTDGDGDSVPEIDVGADEFSDCLDLDGDGYGNPVTATCPNPEADCDDSNANVNPGEVEGPAGDPTCSDELDNNCDGFTDGADSACAAPAWAAADSAEASFPGSSSTGRPGLCNQALLLLVPVGAIILLKARRRRG